MNALLPTLAREFPLADLDILGAFAAAEDPWAERAKTYEMAGSPSTG